MSRLPSFSASRELFGGKHQYRTPAVEMYASCRDVDWRVGAKCASDRAFDVLSDWVVIGSRGAEFHWWQRAVAARIATFNDGRDGLRVRSGYACTGCLLVDSRSTVNEWFKVRCAFLMVCLLRAGVGDGQDAVLDLHLGKTQCWISISYSRAMPCWPYSRISSSARRVRQLDVSDKSLRVSTLL